MPSTRETAHKYIDFLAALKFTEAFEMLAPGAKYRIIGKTPLSNTYSRVDLLNVLAPGLAEFKQPPTLTFQELDHLQRNITELLTRPVGRPSHKPVVRYKSFLYQAASWKTVRRVVANVEFHCGELFPRVGFIVTSLAASSRAVVRFYNKRWTAEQWIKEGKQAVAMTRLSCHRFRANEVRLWLSLIAYNLGNLWRRLVLPTRVATWSLTSLQQRLVKSGGRLIKHARYYWLLLAEVHLTRRLFASMLRKIAALPSPAG